MNKNQIKNIIFHHYCNSFIYVKSNKLHYKLSQHETNKILYVWNTQMNKSTFLLALIWTKIKNNVSRVHSAFFNPCAFLWSR